MPERLSVNWPNRSNAENSTFFLSTKLQVRAAEFFLSKLSQLSVDKMESHWLSTELKAVSCCLITTKLSCLIRFESYSKIQLQYQSEYRTPDYRNHTNTIHSRLSRCSTTRGSIAWVSRVSHTKVEALTSFLFTESSLVLQIKHTWLIFIVTLFSYKLYKINYSICSQIDDLAVKACTKGRILNQK